MTTQPDDALISAQHEVQRLLGLCLLRLQAYERGVKVLLTEHRTAFDASARPLPGSVPDIRQKTLGALVGELLGSVLVAHGQGRQTLADDADFAFLFQLGFSEIDLTSTEADLRDLVALRNRLVHHFLDENDLSTQEGCRTAQLALTTALDRVGTAYGELRQWLLERAEAGKIMAETL